MHRYDLFPLSRAELVYRLDSLSRDEELPPSARMALLSATRASLPPDALSAVLRIAFDCRAGLASSDELSRTVADALAEPPEAA